MRDGEAWILALVDLGEGDEENPGIGVGQDVGDYRELAAGEVGEGGELRALVGIALEEQAGGRVEEQPLIHAVGCGPLVACATSAHRIIIRAGKNRHIRRTVKWPRKTEPESC